MSQMKIRHVKPQTRILDGLDQRASWGEILLALVPFLLLPFINLLGIILISILKVPNLPIIGNGITLAVIGMLLIVMIVGWIKGFPRWCFPYWGFVLLVTFYLQNFKGTVFGLPFQGNWWVWIPVYSVAIIGLLWTRNVEAIDRLIVSIWKDWTLLSFTFYGALPLLFIAAYEEVRNVELVKMTVFLILVVGALLYMRSSKNWPRFACLVGGFSLAWLVTMIQLGLYWNGRQELGMGEPASWAGTLNWTGRMGATLLAILLAPMLIEVIHWVTRSVLAPKTE